MAGAGVELDWTAAAAAPLLSVSLESDCDNERAEQRSSPPKLQNT